VLEVRDGKVHKRAKARPQPWAWHKRHDYRLKRLAKLPPARDYELAGLPACPALAEQRDRARTDYDEALLAACRQAENLTE